MFCTKFYQQNTQLLNIIAWFIWRKWLRKQNNKILIIHELIVAPGTAIGCPTMPGFAGHHWSNPQIRGFCSPSEKNPTTTIGRDPPAEVVGTVQRVITGHRWTVLDRNRCRSFGVSAVVRAVGDRQGDCLLRFSWDPPAQRCTVGVGFSGAQTHGRQAVVSW